MGLLVAAMYPGRVFYINPEKQLSITHLDITHLVIFTGSTNLSPGSAV